MKTIPKVSIVVPCYNNESTIGETLDSIKSQNYENIEVIIINDGSTDNSESTANDYIRLNKVHNFLLANQTNQGPSRARNHGASLASGKYLLFLDADDKIATTFISQCVDTLENQKDINIVYTAGEFFGSKKGPWNLPAFDIYKFLRQNCIPITSMIRLEIFNKVGGFDETLHFTEDWELWIKIIKEFGGVHKISESLFFYRKNNHKNSLTDNKNKENIFEKSVLYIYNKHYDFFKKYRMDIISLLTSENLKYKRKYYNVWYRKLFYKITNKPII